MISKEHNWLINHPEIDNKYAGEYIAIVGEEIVAHGNNFKNVLTNAEKFGKNPYIHKVPYSNKALVV